MSWKPITDATVLRGLLNHRRVGMRMMCLDAVGSDWIELVGSGAGPDAWRKANFGKRYELHAMDTLPASVVVFDGTEQKPLGAYVWTGEGGRIPSSRDDRLVQLADALEAEYRGEPSPVEEWRGPEQLCDECGHHFNTAEGGPAFGVETDLGNGVRSSIEEMTGEKMVDLVVQHCTEAQQRVFLRLLKKRGHVPVMLSNIRVSGGPAIGSVCPIVEDKFGQSWVIAPSGAIERMEDDGD